MISYRAVSSGWQLCHQVVSYFYSHFVSVLLGWHTSSVCEPNETALVLKEAYDLNHRKAVFGRLPARPLQAPRPHIIAYENIQVQHVNMARLITSQPYK